MRVLVFMFWMGCSLRSEDPSTKDIEGTAVDADGDGFSIADGDCNDNDPLQSPQSMEICDGIDNDCDDEIDEGVSTDWYADGDGDGFGDPDTVVTSCQPPSGYVSAARDCDDQNADISPAATEVCDRIDNDCDGLVDGADDSIDASTQETWYEDGDGDGYGDSDSESRGCEAPADSVTVGGDCNDKDSAYYPGAPEDDCTDPNDYNCDGSVGYADGDGDGYAACEECDDSDGSVNPDATEICDERDNDCDTLIDDDDDSLDSTTGDQFFADRDGDGFGNPDLSVRQCVAPKGYITDDGDCDDADATSNPDGTEVCDGADNDCDGSVDEDATDLQTWYADGDGDGYGDASTSVEECTQPSDYTADSSDCDDSRAVVYPGAPEFCDGLDNDCDRDTDEDPVDGTTLYADADEDGHGDDKSAIASCEDLSGYVTEGGDCDDTDEEIYPGADEWCDGVDSDCDGDSSDAGLASFADRDGTWVDLTSFLGAGSFSSPATWTLSDQGTLWLCAGTWFARLDVTASEALIRGLDGSASTTISAGNTGPVVTLNSTVLTLNGLSVKDGKDSNDCGGAIQANSSTLTLNDVAVSDSTAQYGGGLCLESTTLSASDVTFSDSSADKEGGAIYANSSTLSISDGTVSDNVATEEGGGVYLTSSTGTFTDVTFDANEAGNAGGGVYATASSVAADSLVVDDNIAGTDGGGLAAASSSTVDIVDSAFDGNSADSDGGGVYIKDSDFTMEGSTLQGNVATDKGGGLFIDEEDSSMEDVIIDDNEADKGGGVFVNDCLLTLTDIQVSDNTATSDGGGVYIDSDGEISVTRGDWLSNSPEDVSPKNGGSYSYKSTSSFSCDDSSCW